MKRQRVAPASGPLRRNMPTCWRPRYQLTGASPSAVVGKHGYDRVNVVAIPGGDVALRDLAQRVVAK